MDYRAAKAYALERLAYELSPELVYHSLEHTRDEVLPAAERLAALEGVAESDLLLLRTAALFHDLGFVVRPQEHEAAGVAIAETVLPEFGYAHEQIRTIGGIIMATRLPQSPTTPLEAILADADLDVLGREDFLERNGALREELTALGADINDEGWYSGQIRFLSGHVYFTEAAKGLREPKKHQNIALLQTLLEACRA